MSFRLPARQLRLAALRQPLPAARRLPTIAARTFTASAPRRVSVGQEVPDLEVLVEDSPGNKVSLAAEFGKGNGLIIGVPGAFSGACSNSHVPSYIHHPKLAGAGQVFVVAVNDAFV